MNMRLAPLRKSVYLCECAGSLDLPQFLRSRPLRHPEVCASGIYAEAKQLSSLLTCRCKSCSCRCTVVHERKGRKSCSKLCAVLLQDCAWRCKSALNCCAQHVENVLGSLELGSWHCLCRPRKIFCKGGSCSHYGVQKMFLERILTFVKSRCCCGSLQRFGFRRCCRDMNCCVDLSMVTASFGLFSARALLLKWRVFVACIRKSIPRERGRIVVVVEAAFTPPLWLTSSQVYPPDWCKKWCTICCTELWRRVPIFSLESRYSWPLLFDASACSAFGGALARMEFLSGSSLWWMLRLALSHSLAYRMVKEMNLNNWTVVLLAKSEKNLFCVVVCL